MNKKSSSATATLCAVYTALFSLLAHGYRYLSLSFSGDSMLLSQVGEEAYQTSLGRFLQPVYWQIRGYITAPLTIGLFACTFLAASALLVVRLMHFKKPLHIALVCGILTANETMAISNATYLPWTDVYALSLLLSLLGVYVFFEWKHGWLLSPVLYCLSLGLYQSYLPAASTMIILLLMFRLADGENVRMIWRQGIFSIIALVAGLLLYAVTLKAVLALTGGYASGDYNGIARVSLFSFDAIPWLLKATYLTPIQLLFSLSDTPVMTWHITTVPQLLNIVLFGFSGVLLLRRIRRLRMGGIMTLAFLIGVLPLGMNFVQFISHGIASGLTIYSYNLLYLIPVALLDEPKSHALSRLGQMISHAAKAAVCICLSLFLLLNIRTANEMALKRDLEFSSTTAAMSRLLDRAERTQGYVPGETPVVLIGMLPSSSISMERPGFETLAKAQGMRYTYGAAYETSNYWYLTMALGEPIRLVSHEERMRLSDSAQAKTMPAFPQEGCCAMADGMLYIRIN